MPVMNLSVQPYALTAGSCACHGPSRHELGLDLCQGVYFRLTAAQHSMGLSAVQARYENAYVHCLAVLKGLSDPAQSSGVLPDMSPPEREKALQTFLQVSFPFSTYMLKPSNTLLPSFNTPFAENVE